MARPKRKKRHFIAEWMRATGKTNADLIAGTGADKSNVSRWTAGTEPSTDYMDSLAALFGTTVAGLYAPPPRDLTYTSDDPAAPAPDEIDSFEDEPGVGNAALIDGNVVFHGKLPGSQPETMAKGGAGLGQIVDSGVARIQSNGIASGHAVAAEWVIPPSYLRHGLGGQPSATIIVPVIGHSMEPRLNEGDRLIVDVSQNEWIGDAIYLIDDGGTVFQAKTLRKVTSSYPPRYLVISEADREHPDERAATEFRIVGRVVGRISRA